jgi:hypothetical protein
MREKTIKTDRRKLCWMRSSLVASVDTILIEFQTTEAHSNMDLTNVKYSIYEQSSEENLKVMERIRPNSFMHSENMESTWL